jgi:hypothetical protein
MIVYLLYNKDTPAQRQVEDLEKRLKQEQLETELLDADSPRGIQLAENYEVLGRPALILAKDDGSPVGLWQGEDQMPAPGEVAYLAHQ